MFSYSGRVKSPEWRWHRRRADLRHFEIFRHGPIIIYTRLPAGGTYYPICMFPASSECLIRISDTFSASCLRVSVIFPKCSLYPQQKRAYSALHPQSWTYIYTGPCPKALTKCRPLDFRRSSIKGWKQDSFTSFIGVFFILFIYFPFAFGKFRVSFYCPYRFGNLSCHRKQH